MARRIFDVVDIIEILVYWHAGRNNSEIAQSLGVDRKTTWKDVAEAQAVGMRPGGAPVAEERWAELVRQWFPELTRTRLRQITWPAIEAHDYCSSVETISLWPVISACRDRYGRRTRGQSPRGAPVNISDLAVKQPAPPRAERLHPGRSQLDRQRHPVQPLHQPRHHGTRIAIHHEIRIKLAGTLSEKRHRLRLDSGPGTSRSGSPKRRQPVTGFLGQPQRLPAGDQDPDVIRGRQHRRAQLRYGIEHVLAIVQD
jgi:hypothetical protein